MAVNKIPSKALRTTRGKSKFLYKDTDRVCSREPGAGRRVPEKSAGVKPSKVSLLRKRRVIAQPGSGANEEKSTFSLFNYDTTKNKLQNKISKGGGAGWGERGTGGRGVSGGCCNTSKGGGGGGHVGNHGKRKCKEGKGNEKELTPE